MMSRKEQRYLNHPQSSARSSVLGRCAHTWLRNRLKVGKNLKDPAGWTEWHTWGSNRNGPWYLFQQQISFVGFFYYVTLGLFWNAAILVWVFYGVLSGRYTCSLVAKLKRSSFRTWFRGWGWITWVVKLLNGSTAASLCSCPLPPRTCWPRFLFFFGRVAAVSPSLPVSCRPLLACPPPSVPTNVDEREQRDLWSWPTPSPTLFRRFQQSRLLLLLGSTCT